MIESLHEALHSWLAAESGAMRDHIVVSTAILLALAGISLLPPLRARTRHALLILGVAKFLVPSSALSAIFGSLTANQIAVPSFSVTSIFTSAPSPASHSEVLCWSFVLWLAGAVVMALRFLFLQRRWRRFVETAVDATAREIDTMQSIAGGSGARRIPRVVRSTAAIPLTAGILRPVVLLPDACATALSDGELEAVLAHELTHVERRHNLAALVQQAVLVLFWFDPVVWIANSLVRAEAEKDCDERVLTVVPDPPTYLSGMLKVSYGVIAPRGAGVSCMSASRLKERMDHLMKHHEDRTRSVPHRLAVAIGIAAVALTTLFLSAGEKAKNAPTPVVSAADKDVKLPTVLTKVDPKYPPEAREKRVQGIVIVEAKIDAKGNVTSASVAKGVEGEEGKALNEAAVAAVKQWTFEPATKNGKPVAVTFKVTINFKLK